MGLAVTYRQRHPERTPFYQCLEDYWEEFKESYRYFYERDYGSLRPVVDKTVDRFSECGMFRRPQTNMTMRLDIEPSAKTLALLRVYSGS